MGFEKVGHQAVEIIYQESLMSHKYANNNKILKHIFWRTLSSYLFYSHE